MTKIDLTNFKPIRINDALGDYENPTVTIKIAHRSHSLRINAAAIALLDMDSRQIRTDIYTNDSSVYIKFDDNGAYKFNYKNYHDNNSGVESVTKTIIENIVKLNPKALNYYKKIKEHKTGLTVTITVPVEKVKTQQGAVLHFDMNKANFKNNHYFETVYDLKENIEQELKEYSEDNIFDVEVISDKYLSLSDHRQINLLINCYQGKILSIASKSNENAYLYLNNVRFKVLTKILVDYLLIQ